MNSFAIYIDEDAMGRKLVAALRDRDVVVATAYDSNQVKASDERQLEYATSNSFVLYTFNVCDYYQLHTQWLATERNHAGMILAQQQRFSIGEQLNRRLRLRSLVSTEEMRNKAEFLSNWD